MSFAITRLAALFLLMISSGGPAMAQANTAHQFSFTSIDGTQLALSDFAGKLLLVVNTASRCGFTPQYDQLQALWQNYRDQGLVVLGVPSNDFGRQELDSSAAIKEFCSVNFAIDFPMTESSRVKGDAAHPFYLWATEQAGRGGRPRWNFHKYLIGPDGQLIDWFSSMTGPDSDKIIRAIEAHLPPLAETEQLNEAS